MLNSNWFKRGEFACKCGQCDKATVDAELLQVLDNVREHFGRPVVITSGHRCYVHNALSGGELKSKHLEGIAADIQVDSISPKEVQEYLTSKYTDTYGIGSYETFTHVDVRKEKARWNG